MPVVFVPSSEGWGWPRITLRTPFWLKACFDRKGVEEEDDEVDAPERVIHVNPKLNPETQTEVVDEGGVTATPEAETEAKAAAPAVVQEPAASTNADPPKASTVIKASKTKEEKQALADKKKQIREALSGTTAIDETAKA